VKQRKDANRRDSIIHNGGSLVFVPLWIEGSNDREKYRGRLAKFFDPIGLIEGTMEERTKAFTERCKRQTDWVFVSVMRFANVQKERVAKGEISPASKTNNLLPSLMTCKFSDKIVNLF
jgi:hypothetical protein